MGCGNGKVGMTDRANRFIRPFHDDVSDRFWSFRMTFFLRFGPFCFFRIDFYFFQLDYLPKSLLFCFHRFPFLFSDRFMTWGEWQTTKKVRPRGGWMRMWKRLLSTLICSVSLIHTRCNNLVGSVPSTNATWYPGGGCIVGGGCSSCCCCCRRFLSGIWNESVQRQQIIISTSTTAPQRHHWKCWCEKCL